MSSPVIDERILKMAKALIVDGYNVIHRIKKYKDLKQKDLNLAVDSLINDLSSLKAATGWQVSVVFDGRERTLEHIAGVEVIYTAGGQSADAVIEQLSAEAKKETLVASADYEQQKAVFRSSVHRLTPRELDELLTESHQQLKDGVANQKKSFLEDKLPPGIRAKLDEMRRKKTR